MNTLKTLWDSTENLHRRFGVYPPAREQVVRVMFEELSEVVEAASGGVKPDTAAEVADLRVTVMGYCMAAGVPFEMFEHALAATQISAGLEQMTVDIALEWTARRVVKLVASHHHEERLIWIAAHAALVVLCTEIVLKLLGISPEMMNAAMLAVAAKNDAKTHETHAVNAAGKIARRETNDAAAELTQVKAAIRAYLGLQISCRRAALYEAVGDVPPGSNGTREEQ